MKYRLRDAQWASIAAIVAFLLALVTLLATHTKKMLFLMPGAVLALWLFFQNLKLDFDTFTIPSAVGETALAVVAIGFSLIYYWTISFVAIKIWRLATHSVEKSEAKIPGVVSEPRNWKRFFLVVALVCGVLFIVGESWYHPGPSVGQLNWRDKCNWQRLEGGMTRPQVRALFGKPDKIERAGTETWLYGSGSIEFSQSFSSPDVTLYTARAPEGPDIPCKAE